ncbi:MAG: hypothetical protein IT287_02315, partial [Bdellovibrionaceae bacterium]|nr:hypothetical protein [Pseudobdellovibrionaceae bacterium]
LGEYINAEDVKTAFQIVKPMPMQFGVAPNQPCTSGGVFKECSKLWFKMLLALCALQFVFIVINKNETVFTGAFSTSTSSTEKLKVSSQFELKHGTKNIEIKLSSPVQNNWLEVQGDLVNDDNGETIEFEQGVEYYSGYDSDGSWSEGSQRSSIVISSVPSGKYHLNLEPVNGQPYDLNFEITIKRDVTTWSNFMWALILISIIPLILWWRSWRFELSRWSQSDFSPHFLHQESDYE